jgi:hypothetical protein
VNSPGLLKMKENVSSVSSAFDRKAPFVSTTVCGMSSLLTQVTFVPGATVRAAAVKVKLSIRTVTTCDVAAVTCEAGSSHRTATPASPANPVSTLRVATQAS